MPLSDIFAALRWWAVLFGVGAAATPLAFTIFHWLPDRGYAFIKMLGLLLVSYLFWLLGSLGYLGNDLGGILLCLAVLVALSAWLFRQRADPIRRWLRKEWRYLLTVELIFALTFAIWVLIRAQNPAITGTEKPMEFAFLNAVGRSPTFPPLDPWLSGFAISYYYFGYVMTSVIARLALVPEYVAFNLGIAWIVAGTAVGAFGIVYNLVRGSVREEASHHNRRLAIVLGLVAALALPLAGNLQIVLELMHANGIGADAFWKWLDVRDISGPAVESGFGSTGPRFWWWWRSSRVIHEYHLTGIAEEGLEPIAEFPAFSFILGDMHPHVLALPFAFLSLAVALLWWLRPLPALDVATWETRHLEGRFRLLLEAIGLPLLALTAVVLGGLSFLNTWDVLIHLFIVVGAFVLNRWRHHGGWDTRFLGQSLMVAILIAIPAVLLYFPFYLGFRSQAGPPFLLPMLMQPTRLPHFLIIFGMPLWVVVILLGSLVVRLNRRPWRVALVSAATLLLSLTGLMGLLGWIIASSPEGGNRILLLANDLGYSLPPASAPTLIFSRLVWGWRALLTVAPAVLGARLASPWLALLLSLLAGLTVMVWHGRLAGRRQEGAERLPAREEARAFAPASRPRSPIIDNLPFVLLLLFTGALLTVGPEFVYLRDNFGQRLNTIFKFYYQAWLLFGVTAIFGLGFLWRTARLVAIPAVAGYGLMLALALLFPIYGATSRAAEYSHPQTLDGIAHLRYTNPDEHAALMWLRDNTTGTPVIVEAVGGQYSSFGRVSAATGLPTLLGWAGHEYQWRGDTPEPALREPAVETIYTHPDWATTAEMLDTYDVEYIYVGPLERNSFGPSAAEKFRNALEVAYANDDVIIYRWLPQ